jgi:hypothetical protein
MILSLQFMHGQNANTLHSHDTIIQALDTHVKDHICFLSNGHRLLK